MHDKSPDVPPVEVDGLAAFLERRQQAIDAARESLPADALRDVSFGGSADGGFAMRARVPDYSDLWFTVEHRRSASGSWVPTAVCVEVDDADGVPDVGVSARALRKVPLERALKAWAKVSAAGGGTSLAEAVDGPTVGDGRRRMRNRGRRPDIAYALVAERYVELAESSRRVVADLAAETGYAVDTVKDQIKEARRRGLLESLGQGKAGGRITELGRKVLDEANEGEDR